MKRQTLNSDRHHVHHLTGANDLTPAGYKAKLRAIDAMYKLALRRARAYPYSGKDKPGRDPSSSMSLIWRCLYRAKRALTRDELMRRLKIDQTAEWSQWNFSSRLSQMVKDGTAEIVGRKKGAHHSSPLYSAIFAPDEEAVRKAAIDRDDRDDKLAEEWRASPFAGIDSAMLARIPDRRGRRVLRARIAGKCLREISRDLGVTKERVRQLQNRALEMLGGSHG